MAIKEGRLYFIKNEFLNKYGQKYNLMDNKVDKATKRPTYFCFKDKNTNEILWFVPMSRQYDKYINLYNMKKDKIRKEPNNFVFFENIQGMKGVFLIQNMFRQQKNIFKRNILEEDKKLECQYQFKKRY